MSRNAKTNRACHNNHTDGFLSHSFVLFSYGFALSMAFHLFSSIPSCALAGGTCPVLSGSRLRVAPRLRTCSVVVLSGIGALPIEQDAIDSLHYTAHAKTPASILGQGSSPFCEYLPKSVRRSCIIQSPQERRH